MSLPASHYITRGANVSKTARMKSGTRGITMVFYTLCSLASKLFVFTYPLFALADYHIAGQINDTNSMDLNDAFKDSGYIKKYRSAIQYAWLSTLVLFMGVLLIGLLSLGTIQLGFALDEFFGFPLYYFGLFFQILGIGLLVAFIFAKNMYFAPVVFLIQSRTMTLSEALRQSSIIMSDAGRLKFFHIQLYHLGKFILYLLVASAIVYGVFLLEMMPLLIVTLIVMAVLLLKALPNIVLSNNVAKTRLFSDLIHETSFVDVTDDASVEAITKQLRKEDVLLKLFDDIPSEEPKASDLEKAGAK